MKKVYLSRKIEEYLREISSSRENGDSVRALNVFACFLKESSKRVDIGRQSRFPSVRSDAPFSAMRILVFKATERSIWRSQN